MLVEIRSTGSQSIFPGSTHEKTGERIEWVNPRMPVTQISADELHAKVCQVVAFRLLIEHWPNIGARHDAALALNGVLTRHTDFSAELIANLITTLCDGDNWKKHIKLAHDGDRRLAEDRALQGIPALQAVLGKEVTARFCTLMGIEEAKPGINAVLLAINELTPDNAESKAQEIVELTASACLSKIDVENVLKRLHKASRLGMGALRAAYKEAKGHASEVQAETLAQRLFAMSMRGELWHDNENNEPFISVQLEDHHVH